MIVCLEHYSRPYSNKWGDRATGFACGIAASAALAFMILGVWL